MVSDTLKIFLSDFEGEKSPEVAMVKEGIITVISTYSIRLLF